MTAELRALHTSLGAESAATQRIAELEAALRTSEARAAFAEARARNAEAAARDQLELLLKSRSWRITAPLRAIRGPSGLKSHLKLPVILLARQLRDVMMRHSLIRSLIRGLLRRPSIRQLLDAVYRLAGAGRNRPDTTQEAIQATRMGPRARAIHSELCTLIDRGRPD